MKQYLTYAGLGIVILLIIGAFTSPIHLENKVTGMATASNTNTNTKIQTDKAPVNPSAALPAHTHLDAAGNYVPDTGYVFANSNANDFTVVSTTSLHLTEDSSGTLVPADGYDWTNPNDPNDFSITKSITVGTASTIQPTQATASSNIAVGVAPLIAPVASVGTNAIPNTNLNNPGSVFDSNAATNPVTAVNLYPGTTNVYQIVGGTYSGKYFQSTAGGVQEVTSTDGGKTWTATGTSITQTGNVVTVTDATAQTTTYSLNTVGASGSQTISSGIASGLQATTAKDGSLSLSYAGNAVTVVSSTSIVSTSASGEVTDISQVGSDYLIYNQKTQQLTVSSDALGSQSLSTPSTSLSSGSAVQVAANTYRDTSTNDVIKIDNGNIVRTHTNSDNSQTTTTINSQGQITSSTLNSQGQETAKTVYSYTTSNGVRTYLGYTNYQTDNGLVTSNSISYDSTGSIVSFNSGGTQYTVAANGAVYQGTTKVDVSKLSGISDSMRSQVSSDTFWSGKSTFTQWLSLTEQYTQSLEFLNVLGRNNGWTWFNDYRNRMMQFTYQMWGFGSIDAVSQQICQNWIVPDTNDPSLASSVVIGAGGYPAAHIEGEKYTSYTSNTSISKVPQKVYVYKITFAVNTLYSLVDTTKRLKFKMYYADSNGNSQAALELVQGNASSSDIDLKGDYGEYGAYGDSMIVRQRYTEFQEVCLDFSPTSDNDLAEAFKEGLGSSRKLCNAFNDNPGTYNNEDLLLGIGNILSLNIGSTGGSSASNTTTTTTTTTTETTPPSPSNDVTIIEP